MPHLPFSSKDDLNKSFWENILFGRVVVWYIVWTGWSSIFSKHPFSQLSLYSIHPCLQSSLGGKYLALQLNQFHPPNSSDDLCLIFCLYPSSMDTIIDFSGWGGDDEHYSGGRGWGAPGSGRSAGPGTAWPASYSISCITHFLTSITHILTYITQFLICRTHFLTYISHFLTYITHILTYIIKFLTCITHFLTCSLFDNITLFLTRITQFLTSLTLSFWQS